jgi:hypothetical protein
LPKVKDGLGATIFGDMRDDEAAGVNLGRSRIPSLWHGCAVAFA